MAIKTLTFLLPFISYLILLHHCQLLPHYKNKEISNRVSKAIHINAKADSFQSSGNATYPEFKRLKEGFLTELKNSNPEPTQVRARQFPMHDRNFEDMQDRIENFSAK